VRKILHTYEEIGSMYDRTGSTPVEKYILSTLTDGLPLFKHQKTVNDDIKYCLNYIFYKLNEEKDGVKKKKLVLDVAAAYQSCQTVQQQAITNMYASLAGVDFSFEKQTLKLLSSFKLRKLEELVILIHPNANLVGDDNPYGQPPHIRSAYLLALDERKIFIDGKEASLLDVNKPNLSNSQKNQVEKAYRKLLSGEEFVLSFISEINQTGGFSEYIDRDKFYKWVMALTNNFDKHSVHYDETRADDYEQLPTNEEQQDGTAPYLSFHVGVHILEQLNIVKRTSK